MILYKSSKRVAETLHKWRMPFGRKKLSHLTPNDALDEVSFVRGLSTQTVVFIVSMALICKSSSSSLLSPYLRM